jgi:hypothetical protein
MAHHQGTGDLYSHNNSRLFNAMVGGATRSLACCCAGLLAWMWCTHIVQLTVLCCCLRETFKEFHAFITLGGCPPECCYPLKGVGFLPTGWGE